MSEVPQFLLGRQPILDRGSNTVAYELLFRSTEGGAVTDNRRATATVIAHAFNELGLAAVLGNARAFINFDAELLLSDTVELLPRERTVLEILETVEVTPEVVDRCGELRAKGFGFALDDIIQLDEAHGPILPFIDVIKVDVLAIPPGDLQRVVRSVRRPGVKLLAEKVDSHEQARRCMELGFDLFQGFFFAKPVVLRGRRADPSRRVLVELLQRVLTNASNREIELLFKQAPELSYKLMRLVNSVGMGLREPIRSLAHALVVLGRQQLQRWLQLLLFAHHSTGDFPSPLLNLAAGRGKLMELLAEKGSSDREFRELAFMSGILSLLDTLMEMPMAEVLAQISLPEEVRAALLQRAGHLGHLLQVVEALERGDAESVSRLLAQDDPCDTAELPQIQIAALAWSNQIGEPMAEAEAVPSREGRVPA